MSSKFLKPILINLSILVLVFTAFIFFDKSFSNSPIIKTPQSVKPTNLTISIPESKDSVPVFDWKESHYLNKNILNTDTNYLVLKINSNETKKIAFYSEKIAYYRFEIARFIVRGINPQRCIVTVQQGETTLPSYLGPRTLNLVKYGSDYVASWFYDWNTPVGKYNAVLWIDGVAVARTFFAYIKREPVKFNRSFSVLNLEFPIFDKTIRSPQLEPVAFNQGIKQWMDYGEIDGFLTLAGQTSGYDNVSISKPWSPVHLKNVQKIGKEIHDSGRLFGAYIMCFYTPEQGWKKAGYNSALGVGFSSNGTAVAQTSKFTSFTDPKRFNDIVSLAQQLNNLPYVDMIGFDFIRFGEKVGYENADEFARDMNITLPQYWSSYTLNQKVIWMAGILKKSTNQQKWWLWKAHKSAELIYRVIQEGKLTKPVWVFTLGWDHGTDHGQDPILFQDAGVLADFVMLYEASPQMFTTMKNQWTTYLKQERVNYIPGNQIDAVVNKSLGGRNPVEEYTYRLNQGETYAEYLARGVFIHDIHRAFFSKRRSQYSYLEWLYAGLASSGQLRYLKGETPFKVDFNRQDINYSKNQTTVNVPVTISFRPDKLAELQGKSLTLEGGGKTYIKKLDIKSETNVTLYIKVNPKEKGARYQSLKAKIEGYPSYFAFRYLNFKKNSE